MSPYEESFDVAVLARISNFEVPQSAHRDSIRIRLAGSVGPTTAYKFDQISLSRTDSLFRIAVWGRWAESSGSIYDQKPTLFDTLLVLRSTKTGKHYFEVFASNGTLRDSTNVY